MPAKHHVPLRLTFTRRRHLLRLSILAASAILPLGASADTTNIYIGPDNDTWAQPSYWSLGRFPKETDNVVINGPTPFNTEYNGGANYINSLSTSGIVSLYTSVHLRISQYLSNAGTLDLSTSPEWPNNYLEFLAPQATISGPGTLLLNATLFADGTLTLNHNIQGSGTIIANYQLINLGTLTASSNQTLYLPGGLINNGIIRSNAGTLSIDSHSGTGTIGLTSANASINSMYGGFLSLSSTSSASVASVGGDSVLTVDNSSSLNLAAITGNCTIIGNVLLPSHLGAYGVPTTTINYQGILDIHGYTAFLDGPVTLNVNQPMTLTSTSFLADNPTASLVLNAPITAASLAFDSSISNTNIGTITATSIDVFTNTVNATHLQNHGMLQAAAGAKVFIDDTYDFGTTSDNIGGSVVALTGGSVGIHTRTTFNNAGGLLLTLPGGFFQLGPTYDVANPTVINGGTLSGAFTTYYTRLHDVTLSSTSFTGNPTLAGTVNLEGDNSGISLLITGTKLTGPGTLTLALGSPFLPFDPWPGSSVITNLATIRGSGELTDGSGYDFNIINDGLIDSQGFRAGNITNRNGRTLRASAGTTTVADIDGGTIDVLPGATLIAKSIRNADLSAPPGALIRPTGFAGTITLTNTVVAVGNHDTFSNIPIQVESNSLFTGSGTLVLSSTSPNTSALLQGNSSSRLNTNIQGSGILQGMTNAGTIFANGSTISLSGLNQGLVRALNGGITLGSVDNTGGLIEIGDKSSLYLGNLLSGGTLSMSASAALTGNSDSPSGSSSFANLTLLGQVTLKTYGFIYFGGNIDNLGTIVIDSQFALGGARIGLPYTNAPVTLMGGGTLSLVSDPLHAPMIQNFNGVPFATDNTIVGGGSMWPHAFFTSGSIIARGPVPLEISATSVTSTGLLLADAQTLNLRASTLTLSGPLLAQNNGELKIAGRAEISSQISLSNAAVRFLSYINGATSSATTISGTGTLQVSNTSLTADTVNVTTLQLDTKLILRSHATATTSSLSNLTLAGTTDAWTATLDLTNNSLILQSSSPTDKATKLPTLQSQLLSGYHNGDYLGTGITSSTVAADPAHLTLALTDNADLHYTSFRGQPTDNNSLIIVQALLGDATLDGTVDSFDLNILAAHWQMNVPGSNLTGTPLWSAGDFTGDNKVDAFDLNILAANWQSSLTLEAALAASEISNLNSGIPFTPIPEPASLTLLLPITLFLTRRNRRRYTS